MGQATAKAVEAVAFAIEISDLVLELWGRELLSPSWMAYAYSGEKGHRSGGKAATIPEQYSQ